MDNQADLAAVLRQLSSTTATVLAGSRTIPLDDLTWTPTTAQTDDPVGVSSVMVQNLTDYVVELRLFEALQPTNSPDLTTLLASGDVFTQPGQFRSAQVQLLLQVGASAQLMSELDPAVSITFYSGAPLQATRSNLFSAIIAQGAGLRLTNTATVTGGSGCLVTMGSVLGLGGTVPNIGTATIMLANELASQSIESVTVSFTDNVQLGLSGFENYTPPVTGTFATPIAPGTSGVVTVPLNEGVLANLQLNINWAAGDTGQIGVLVVLSPAMPEVSLTGRNTQELLYQTNVVVGAGATVNLAGNLDVAAYQSLSGGMYLSATPGANVNLVALPHTANGNEAGGGGTLALCTTTTAINWGNPYTMVAPNARIAISNSSTGSVTASWVAIEGRPN